MKFSTLRNSLWRSKINPWSTASLVELVGMTFLPLCAGFLLRSEDPFFLQSHFPILLIPPFLMALRYGLTFGMTSLALILFSLIGAYAYGVGNIEPFPRQLLFGMFVLTLLTGEMTDHLLAKIRRSQAEIEFLNRRFGEFTNTYHVMKVSHDQLREQIANAKFSLREALQAVREKLQKHYREGQRGLNPQVGGELLSIFDYFCATQIAAVYIVRESGRVASNPEAVQGNMGKLKQTDRLIHKALAEGTLVSIQPEMCSLAEREELETDLMAVIPIKDSCGYTWGIVAIAEMQFTAFEEENLNLMQLIASYAGDLLSQAENVFYGEDDYKRFVEELEISWRMAKEFGVVSSIICVTFQQTIPTDDYFRAIVSRIRGLDHAWLRCNEGDKTAICLLMPLMAASDYPNFRSNLTAIFEDRFGLSLEDAGGIFHYMEIGRKERVCDIVSFFTDKIDGAAGEIAATSSNSPSEECDTFCFADRKRSWNKSDISVNANV